MQLVQCMAADDAIFCVFDHEGEGHTRVIPGISR